MDRSQGRKGKPGAEKVTKRVLDDMEKELHQAISESKTKVSIVC